MDKKPTSFELAATETLRRIRRDLESAPPRLKPILSYIESHLYEAGLDFQQLRIACKIRDNTVPIEFHSVIGMPPYTYIKHCRLETAARLLRDTELKVWQICMLVGYSGIQVFSRAFLEWSGMRPTAYRKKKQCEAAGGDGQEAVSSTRSSPPTSAFLRRAVQGKLETGEAHRLIGQLRRLYPPKKRNSRPAWTAGSVTSAHLKEEGSLQAVPDGLLLEPQTIEQIRAEEVWRAIEQLEPADRSAFLERSTRLGSPDLFELLRQQSLIHGRQDRRRGVELAQLALDSLQVLEPGSLDEHSKASLSIRAWAWLGNAYRLALDYLESEKAFLRAERLLPDLGEGGDSALADLFALKASLRWYQQRYPEALELIVQATPHAHRAGLAQLVPILILKASIEQSSGLGDGVESLLEARQHVDKLKLPRLKASVYHSLVTQLAMAGDYLEATKLLPLARQLSHGLGSRTISLKLTWVEGLIALQARKLGQAEQLFRQAREGFQSQNRPDLTAMVSLDLAMLFSQQGRSNEVLWLVSEIVPIFDAMQHLDSALVALKLLQKALDAREVSLMTLEKSRQSLHRLQWEPSLQS